MRILAVFAHCCSHDEESKENLNDRRDERHRAQASRSSARTTLTQRGCDIPGRRCSNYPVKKGASDRTYLFESKIVARTSAPRPRPIRADETKWRSVRAARRCHSRLERYRDRQMRLPQHLARATSRCQHLVWRDHPLPRQRIRVTDTVRAATEPSAPSKGESAEMSSRDYQRSVRMRQLPPTAVMMRAKRMINVMTGTELPAAAPGSSHG